MRRKADAGEHFLARGAICRMLVSYLFHSHPIDHMSMFIMEPWKSKGSTPGICFHPCGSACAEAPLFQLRRTIQSTFAQYGLLEARGCKVNSASCSPHSVRVSNSLSDQHGPRIGWRVQLTTLESSVPLCWRNRMTAMTLTAYKELCCSGR